MANSMISIAWLGNRHDPGSSSAVRRQWYLVDRPADLPEACFSLTKLDVFMTRLAPDRNEAPPQTHPPTRRPRSLVNGSPKPSRIPIMQPCLAQRSLLH